MRPALQCFSCAVDGAKASHAAESLEHLLCFTDIMPLLRKPEEFEEQIGDGAYSVVLGGPGVGKTRKLSKAIEILADTGQLCILTSDLTPVRNQHVSMLRALLDDKLFDCVRVEGRRGLDELSRSRTMPALLWERMKPDVRRRYNVECPALIDVTPSVAVGEVSDAEEEVDDAESVDWDES